MRRLGVFLAAAALLVVGGCGGDDDPKADPTATSPSASSAGTDLKTTCVSLLGENGLAQQALNVVDTPSQSTEDIQAQLFAIVSDGPAALSDSVGQLVDFLDGPKAYIDGGKLSKTISSAVLDIQKTCA